MQYVARKKKTYQPYEAFNEEKNKPTHKID